MKNTIITPKKMQIEKHNDNTSNYAKKQNEEHNGNTTNKAKKENIVITQRTKQNE